MSDGVCASVLLSSLPFLLSPFPSLVPAWAQAPVRQKQQSQNWGPPNADTCCYLDTLDEFLKQTNPDGFFSHTIKIRFINKTRTYLKVKRNNFIQCKIIYRERSEPLSMVYKMDSGDIYIMVCMYIKP